MLPRAKNALHLSRWKRIKEGSSIEKVAEEDGVSKTAVRNSFLNIETYKNIYSMQQLETAQIEMIMDLQEGEKLSLTEAFKAKIRTFVGNSMVETPDHDTALSASHVITERISALRPNKGGLTINASASAGASSSSSSSGGSVSFEDRLRKILQKREQEKSSEAIEVPALTGGTSDDSNVTDEDSA